LPEGFTDAFDGSYINGEAISDSIRIDHKSVIDMDETIDENELLIPIRVLVPAQKIVWFYTPKEIVEAIHRRLSFIQLKIEITKQNIPDSKFEHWSITWSPEISHGFPKDYTNQEFTIEQIRSIFSQLLLADAFRSNGPVSKYPEVLAFFSSYEDLYKEYSLLLDNFKKRSKQWSEKKENRQISREDYNKEMDVLERNMKFKETELFRTIFEKHDLKFGYSSIVQSWTCPYDQHENPMNHNIEIIDPGLVIDGHDIDPPVIVSAFKGNDQVPIPLCGKCQRPKTPETEGPGAVINDAWIRKKKTSDRISRLLFFLSSKAPSKRPLQDDGGGGGGGGPKKKK
jgi:hypothetical protein